MTSDTLVSTTITLFGAYIADAKLGKYRTILMFSIIYSFGGIFLSISAIPQIVGQVEGHRSPWAMIIGLGLITIGTGGIKPVISTFCGDQLGDEGQHMVQKLFQMFYWSVNLGATLSTFLTPLLRQYVSYWFAFGVPSFLIIIATCIFIYGKPTYRVRPVTGSVISESLSVIALGLKETISSKDKQDHWLDRAKSKYSYRTVEGVKAALNVLLVFVPLPFFWSLYDQTGSRWTIQASAMDLRITSKWSIQPDQIQTLGPLLVMICIPLTEIVLYAPLRRRNIEFHPLRRMSIGMWLAVASFLVAMAVQLRIDANPANSVSVWLQFPQYLILTIGEILLSITGLEFAYSQAPSNMKSIIMSGWLLSVAMGNLFVVFVVSALSLPSQWQEYLFFASIMALFTLIFMVIAYRFKSPSDPSILLPDDTELNTSSLGSIQDSSYTLLNNKVIEA
eukprot:gene17887-21336_t